VRITQAAAWPGSRGLFDRACASLRLGGDSLSWKRLSVRWKRLGINVFKVTGRC
jgi:hypothetical protein